VIAEGHYDGLDSSKRQNCGRSFSWEELVAEAQEVTAESVTWQLEYMWMDSSVGDWLFGSMLLTA